MTFTLALLLFFLLVRYVVPRVLRVVLSSFVRQQVHKAQQAGGFPPGFHSAGGFGNFQQRPPAQPGQVRVEYVPPQMKEGRKSEFRGGEYVDYEEVPQPNKKA